MDALGTLIGAQLRLWRYDGRTPRPFTGSVRAGPR
jgi:hypothetical protein